MGGKYIAVLLLVVLLSSLCAVYLSQAKLPNEVTVWISNGRCVGLDNRNKTSLFVFAPIKNQEATTVFFYGNGLQQQTNISNTKYLAMCEGIAVWANDTLNAYQFPLVTDKEDNFIDSIYLSVTDIHITATVDGKGPL